MNLVIGAAGGYTFDQLAPFVRSLRGARYADEIVILNYGLADETKASLGRHGVIVMNPDSPAPISNINQARYSAYAAFLRRNTRRYHRVFVSDVRDVIFQSNPFLLDTGPGLACFGENGVIGGDNYNSNWIKDLYGDAALKYLADKTVACSGTIMGSVDSMQACLDRMVREIQEHRGTELWGRDQGIYNYLLWTDRLQDTRLFMNGVGVYTLALVPGADIKFNAKADIISKYGAPAVIHQYDRHPMLAAHVQARWSERN